MIICTLVWYCIQFYHLAILTDVTMADQKKEHHGVYQSTYEFSVEGKTIEERVILYTIVCIPLLLLLPLPPPKTKCILLLQKSSMMNVQLELYQPICHDRHHTLVIHEH